MRISSESAAQPGGWVLYRIDDNGNEVEMRRFAGRAEAERMMREYERRGHKQAYLVRRAHGDRTP